MERTESIVIQVAPSYENARIKEMEMFGWNLQGRQEIHEEGEAYGRESFVGTGTYVVKTKVSKYVKLHFIRAFNTPNLKKIKQIEEQYFDLPFPELPGFKSFLWPLLLILCAIMPAANVSRSDNNIVGAIICFVIGISWLFYKLKKRQNNIAICTESIKKQEELINQLGSLA